MASLFPAGPVLPEFKSLVVKGPYHPSAPAECALHPNRSPTPSPDSHSIVLSCNFNLTPP
ncbi:hypothetical protein R3P38DRAFT_3050677 [Favolaschia claudopus]|uniref:Uncharacterized protein n=1 Tax=Favolaschia claudopus TaxID=2862362 RepID=A0AAW0A5B6_9AGAR